MIVLPMLGENGEWILLWGGFLLGIWGLGVRGWGLRIRDGFIYGWNRWFFFGLLVFGLRGEGG